LNFLIGWPFCLSPRKKSTIAKINNPQIRGSDIKGSCQKRKKIEPKAYIIDIGLGVCLVKIEEVS
jgi:hypothetical protein